MFSAELKERTRIVHAELEKKLVTRIRKITTPADYIDLLELMYGFYHPLQQLLEPFLQHESVPIPYRGRKADNILADINCFHPGRGKVLPVCTDLPFLFSYPAAVGALYVTEGSALGGRIIAGMISGQLQVSITAGFSFFNAYGNETKLMWDKFKMLLDSHWTAEEKEQVAEAATATFSTFKNWINCYESAAHQQI